MRIGPTSSKPANSLQGANTQASPNAGSSAKALPGANPVPSAKAASEESVTLHDAKARGTSFWATYGTSSPIVTALIVGAVLVVGFHLLRKLTKLFFQIAIVAGIVLGASLLVAHFHLITW